MTQDHGAVSQGRGGLAPTPQDKISSKNGCGIRAAFEKVITFFQPHANSQEAVFGQPGQPGRPSRAGRAARPTGPRSSNTASEAALARHIGCTTACEAVFCPRPTVGSPKVPELQLSNLAVRVRLKKSNYFFEGGSCSTASWDEILSWGVRACPPPLVTQNHGLCHRRGGLASPYPRRNFQLWHILNLHYTNQ